MATNEQILDALADAFDEKGNFDAGKLFTSLHALGVHEADEYAKFYLTDEAHALAAAIEYYEGDVHKAVAAIDGKEYRWHNAYDDEELGFEILRSETGETLWNRLPELLIDYLNTEKLGEDVREQESGEYTRFGYFAPEVW